MQELADAENGLWTFHQRLSVLGAEIGTRMTVVRLRNGGLLVHSPNRLTPEIEQQLASLGEVEHVLAPNLDHYLFVRDFKQRFPKARFYAAPGVAPKLPELRFDGLLQCGQTAPLDDDGIDLSRAGYAGWHRLSMFCAALGHLRTMTG